MPTTPDRRDADEGAQSRPLDDNDPLLKDVIDDKWMDEADDRIAREFARQLIQQENAHMTTLPLSRVANVRALDQLQRTLERISHRRSVKNAQRATKHAVNADDAFAALERRLSDLIERAAAERDSLGAGAE